MKQQLHVRIPVSLILSLIFFSVSAQEIKVEQETNARLSDTLSTSSNIDRNIEMSNLYKQVNPLSLIAPAGELGSGNSYLFTADVNPLFVFSNNIRSRLSLVIGIRVPIRMFTENTFPIRTPSYIPSLRLYYNWRNDPERYRFLWGGFTHHSNGQDGPALINGQWNTRSGNFSTNWITGTYEWGDNFGAVRKHWSVGLLQHAELGNNLSQEDALKDLYGQTRLDARFQRRTISNIRVLTDNVVVKRYSKEMRRWDLHLQLITGGHSGRQGDFLAKSINFEIYHHWFLMKMKDGGFFVGAGYYGEDPYNIFFNQRYGFLKFGLSAGGLFFKVLE